MAHARRQIREAAAAALASVPQVGGRVFQSRLYPLQDADLPCLVVTTPGETVEASTSAKILQRVVNLEVVIKVKTTTDFDDEVDAISVEVETSLANAAGAALRNVQLTEVNIEFDEADQPTGTAILSYQASVFTNSNAPETLL